MTQPDYFQILNLHCQFELEKDTLQTAYHRAQHLLHPDKGGNMQASAQVNAAYRTLRDPFARAVYYLSLKGFDLNASNDSGMSADFLMAQMEWHECLEALDVKNTEEVKAFEASLSEAEQDLWHHFKKAIAQESFESALDHLRALKFFKRLRSTLDTLLC